MDKPVTCGCFDNLIEYMKACIKAKKAAAKSGTKIKMPELHLRACRRKAIFAAPVKGTLRPYCAKHFLSAWLHADISKKVKLL